MFAQIHAYAQHDETRGAYFDIWREWVDIDDAAWLMSVPREGIESFKQLLVPMGEHLFIHDDQRPEPAWNEPITLRLVEPPSVGVSHGDLPPDSH